MTPRTAADGDAPAVQKPVHRWQATAPRRDRPAIESDLVVVEEPLEIRIEHAGRNTSIAVTMRTPGDDIALATGFLFTEGIVDAPADLVEVRRCAEPGPDGEPVQNIIQVLLRPGHAFDPGRFARHVYTTSSCGLCGKASIDALDVHCTPSRPRHPRIDAAVLSALPERLRAAQRVFADTGGIHATGLFTPGGDLVDLAEDVGRHNAMDKVIGRAFAAGRTPLADHVAVVSGRLSFEIVQKAARAGIPVVAGIGAASSLAVEAATRFGMTLVGFLADDRFNVYTDAGRLDA